LYPDFNFVNDFFALLVVVGSVKLKYDIEDEENVADVV